MAETDNNTGDYSEHIIGALNVVDNNEKCCFQGCDQEAIMICVLVAEKKCYCFCRHHFTELSKCMENENQE
jgi:hypothetical protein